MTRLDTSDDELKGDGDEKTNDYEGGRVSDDWEDGKVGRT